MLLPLFILPITTIFCICFSNTSSKQEEIYSKNHLFKIMALTSSCATLFYSLWLWLTFPRISTLTGCITLPAAFRSEGDFVFQAQHNLNLALISLSSFIIIIGLLASWYSSLGGRILTVLLLLTEICLIGAFSCTNIFMFLLLFELSAMPIFILISYAGSPRRERVKASYYFIGFTLYGSLALFLVFLNVYAYFQVSFVQALTFESAIFWILLFVTFSVKVPLFPFHTWLPYAHVEASTTASIILAALLLKLGGFAIIKFLLPFFSVGINFYFRPLAWAICLFGLIYAALCAMRQIDMKRQIAFSSISHMSFAVLGIFSFSEIGLKGAVYLMISHGLTSAILFYLVGMLSDRSHSRSVFAYSGLLETMPIFVFFLIFSSLANVGFPGTSGFLPELFTLIGLLSSTVYLILPTLFGMFLSTAGSLLLVLRLVFGHLKSYSNFSFSDATRLETFVLGIITALILWFGLNDPWACGVSALSVFAFIKKTKHNIKKTTLSLAATPLCLLSFNINLVDYVHFFIAFSSEILSLFSLFALLFATKFFTGSSDNGSNFFYVVLDISLICLCCELVLQLAAGGGDSCSGYGSHYVSNMGVTIMKLLLTLLYYVVYVVSENSSGEEEPVENLVAYSLVLLFATALLSTDHFVLFFIALEGLSLTLYILPVIDKSVGGAAASAKYFAFGTLGSVFILWGIANVYSFYPSLVISELGTSIANADASLKVVIEQNIQFIFVGLLIKLGAAPGHFWVPDVYSGSPLRIMLLFATFVKATLFIVFWQIAMQTNPGGETELAAALSILVGCFYAFRQKEIKRFLAYSSIAHTGFLLLGDIVSASLYLIIYLVATILFFSVLLEFKLIKGSHTAETDIIYLTDLRFINFRDQPLFAFFMFVALASMAGIPPFGGFYIKLLIFTDLAENIALYNDFGSYALFVVALCASILTMLYYIRIINYLLIGSTSLKRWWGFVSNYQYAETDDRFSKDARIVQNFSTIFLIFTIILIPLIVAFFVLVIN